MKILAPILSIFLLMPVLTKAQGEYDDLYYTPADRETAKQKYLKINRSTSQSVDNRLADNSDYKITTPSIYNDRINNTSQGRTVNPEYVAQYRSRSDARKQNSAQEDVYYDENYQADYYEDDNAGSGTIINNYNNYYGSGSWANPYYDPFYVNNWRWRYNDWRWRRSSWYHDPFWNVSPGWHVNISFGWGHHHGMYGHRWSRWSYDPWYSPYYGGGHYYSNFYDPFYRPVYYKTVYVNNEYVTNNSIRRGPATSRGSVINSRRTVANEGPVRRVPVNRSSLDGDANGRVGSAVNSGRVVERSGVQTRSAGNVSTRSRSSAVDRSAINSRTDRSSRKYVPTTRQRSTIDRSENSRRSNSTIDRSNERRRSTSPSRSETRRDNSSRYTPSRSNDNRSSSPRYREPQQQRSQPSYTPPQRSSSPSYNRGGGSSRGSSVSPSRSTSSPSRGTSRSSGGSSRRGGR